MTQPRNAMRTPPIRILSYGKWEPIYDVGMLCQVLKENYRERTVGVEIQTNSNSVGTILVPLKIDAHGKIRHHNDAPNSGEYDISRILEMMTEPAAKPTPKPRYDIGVCWHASPTIPAVPPRP